MYVFAFEIVYKYTNQQAHSVAKYEKIALHFT